LSDDVDEVVAEAAGALRFGFGLGSRLSVPNAYLYHFVSEISPLTADMKFAAK
jgi:hypothetical protein